MTAKAFTDAEGREAFKKFERLLERVQVGSPVRAKGADLRAAKRAYEDYLPVLQPLGQYMMDRVGDTLDRIRNSLRLPPRYSLSATDYRRRDFAQFEAGKFQLNRNGSIYVTRDTHGTEDDPALDLEIRVFTNDPHVFVPAQMKTAQYGFGRDLAVFSPEVSRHPHILYADSYDAIVEAVIVGVQAQLDALPRAAAVEAIAEAELQNEAAPEDETEFEGMKP